MSYSRRRFLTITAAFAAMPMSAQAHSWQGHAFGAKVSLTIRGPKDHAKAAMLRARALLTKVEGLFSLYDPLSALSTLNSSGMLARSALRFASASRLCLDLDGATGKCIHAGSPLGK